MENAEAASGQVLSIGRKQELTKLDIVLQRHRPAMVVVTGAPGIGKTTLLQVFQSHAVAHGWRTTSSSSEGMVRVIMNTTDTTFSEQVSNMLGISADQSFQRGTPTDKPSFAEELRLETVYAPILLLIDGYQPSPEFGQWFTDRFIKELKRTERPVVVVIAERPEAVTKLLPLADETIHLGQLERQAVRQHLESIGRHIVPKIEPKELKKYIEACQKSPELLDSLTRVLRLMEPRKP